MTPGLNLLATVNVDSANQYTEVDLDADGYDAYEYFIIKAYGIYGNTQSQLAMQGRINGEGSFSVAGTDYKYLNTGYHAGQVANRYDNNTVNSLITFANDQNIIHAIDNGKYVNLTMELPNPTNSSSFSSILATVFGIDNSNDQYWYNTTGSIWNNNSAASLDGVRFYSTSGRLQGGTFKLYGVRT